MPTRSSTLRAHRTPLHCAGSTWPEATTTSPFRGTWAWVYNINYSVQYGNYPPKGYKSIVDQSIQLNGSFNITPKTGISVSTGYSFRDRDFTLTSINISATCTAGRCRSRGFRSARTAAGASTSA